MLHPKRTLQNIHACLQSDNIDLGRSVKFELGKKSKTSSYIFFSMSFFINLYKFEKSLPRFGAHTIFDSQDFLPSDDDVISSDEDQVDGKVSPNLELSTSDTEWETVTMDTSTSAPDSGDLRVVSAGSENDPRPSTATSLVSSVTSLWPWKR